MEKSAEKRGRGQAAPLLVDHLIAISAACPDNSAVSPTGALVLMHFAVAGREHELAATPRPRLRRHCRRDPGRPARVEGPAAAGAGAVRDTALHLPRPGVDRVAHRPDGPAWRRLHSRWNTVMAGGLQPESVGDVITRAGQRAAPGSRSASRDTRPAAVSRRRRG
ncbi:hypothetical protein OHA91_39360 (plasmid) [Streptomyces erythrochromogenes]|uniref:Uncharacterized protein n=1 Tax=Streptomyces erythrochromogenes TaxID=285574 RepID=A0ABZ1QPH1_9ACTN|nr:hypothetical protein [Streptomyces erythrochromogenes]